MLKFELKKISHCVPLYIIIGLFILIAVGGGFWQEYQAKIKVDAIEQRIEKEIVDYQKALKETNDNQELVENLKTNLSLKRIQLKSVKGDRKGYLNGFISETKSYLPLLSPNTIRGPLIYDQGSVPLEVYQKTYEELKILQKKQIEPIYPLVFLANFYKLGDLSSENLKDWRESNEQNSGKVWYYLWKMIQTNRLSFVVILAVLLTSVSLSQLLSKYSLYQGEGISVNKIIIISVVSKYLTILGAILAIVMGLLVVNGTVIGFGELNYPILVGTGDLKQMSFISLEHYLLEVLGLVLLLGLFLVSFSQLIEAVMPSAIMAMVSELVLITMGIWVLPDSKWNPFAYYNIDNILTFRLERVATASLNTGWGISLYLIGISMLSLLLVRLIIGWRWVK